MAASDSQTLVNEGTCYICAGATELQAIEMALLARIVANGLGPVASNAIITENGIPIITEDGQVMIIE